MANKPDLLKILANDNDNSKANILITNYTYLKKYEPKETLKNIENVCYDQLNQYLSTEKIPNSF